jgi:hypothetical protein
VAQAGQKPFTFLHPFLPFTALKLAQPTLGIPAAYDCATKRALKKVHPLNGIVMGFEVAVVAHIEHKAGTPISMMRTPFALRHLVRGLNNHLPEFIPHLAQ